MSSAQVRDEKTTVRGAKLRVAARNFGVVQADAVAGVAADADDGFAIAEVELAAFVRSLEHQQARHADLKSWGVKSGEWIVNTNPRTDFRIPQDEWRVKSGERMLIRLRLQPGDRASCMAVR